MALPGLVGTDHIGFTVPDLEEAHDFFVRVLGCTHVYTLGPYQHDDDWMREHLNVHPRTVMRELRFYRCGTGANFEVFEYEPADGQAPIPRNSDIGGHHLAFYVARSRRRGRLPSRRGYSGAGRTDGQSQCQRRPAMGVLSQPVGHAVRAGQLPERQGLREGCRGVVVEPEPPGTVKP